MPTGPERNVSVRVGTASWTDPTLVRDSDWYPKRSMTAEQRLRYYASIFTLVEVDATYYYPPSRQLAGLWTDRTPPDFRFDVKAYSLLTGHPTRPDSLWPDVAAELPAEVRAKRSVYLHHLPPTAVDRAFAAFADALLPLDSAGKLAAVMFQFPPWFTNSRENRAFLRDLPGRLPGLRASVEFRHASWIGGDDGAATFSLLEEAGLAYVVVDEPQGFANSVPPVLAVTADLALVRFHGHNRETWNARNLTAAERFRYRYSTAELEEWVPRVGEVAARARETHLIMNNCWRDDGVRNARELATLLGEGLAPDPPTERPERPDEAGTPPLL